jgi:hypothetical protein
LFAAGEGGGDSAVVAGYWDVGMVEMISGRLDLGLAGAWAVYF